MTKEKNKQNDQDQEQETSEMARTSQRFMEKVQDAFNQELATSKEFTEYEKQLARHLFIRINKQLKTFESKRSNKSKLPYKWNNIDLEQLAIDAVHRINLGLDALIPNHISPVPYFSKDKNKYTLNLQIGYKGKDYYRRKAAVEEPKDIRYELVYSNDTFKPIKKDKNNEVEFYVFKPADNAFDRGDIIGGFGYIVFEDETKNKLVTVSEEEFQKSQNIAKSNDFWSKWPDRMRYKTLVHRTTEQLQIDPEKTNAKSFGYVEQEEIDNLKDIEKQDNKTVQGSQEFQDFEEVADEEQENKQEQKEQPDEDKSKEETPQKEF